MIPILTTYAYNDGEEALARKEAAARYLSKKGITLWGDWDISKPEGLEKAAEWLSRQVEGVVSEVLAMDWEAGMGWTEMTDPPPDPNCYLCEGEDAP